MAEISNAKQICDLEKGNFVFARDARLFVDCLINNLIVYEDGRQLIKSSGSKVVNYFETSEV